MKTKIIFIIICIRMLADCNLQFSQNITNTLGTLGVFKIKDGAADYLTLTQSTGQVNILKTLRLENTTSSSDGVIYKGVSRFLHNYGFSNTFLGLLSGNFTMSGTGNTAVGYQSLLLNTTGYENSAFGVYSLSGNTTGFWNSAFGFSSLINNTTGYENSAFGVASLVLNTTGYWNSAFGRSSLLSNTTGYDNSAFGFESLFSNTIGRDNSAFGYQSLYNNTGNYNSAFGVSSLFSNAAGVFNSAFGGYSLSGNITGNYNSAFGYSSLYDNSGSNNSASGYNSLRYNTTGNDNSAFGYSSLSGNTIGSNNTAIGFSAQVPDGTLSNQVRIGNTFVTYAGVQVAWTITSDRRLKSNIGNSNLGLNFISKLRPVSYTRNNDQQQKTEYGLIAQEIEEALKEEGVNNPAMITVTDEGNYELRYNDLFAPMIKAIQELKVENDELKEKLTKLEQMQNLLASEIEKMKLNNMNTKEVKLGDNK